MSTERQKNASRANGSKSRGATTPEGKLASSRNAIKHGLSAESVRHAASAPYPRNAEAPRSTSGQHGMLATTIVLNGESTDRFLGLLTTLLEEFQPQTPFEESLIEIMAVARWRQMRIWGMEKASMEYEMHRQSEMSNSAALDPAEHAATRAAIAFRTLSDDSRSLELINRYESRYDRQYLRAHRRFLDVQDRRTPPSVQPPEPLDYEGTFPSGVTNRDTPVQQPETKVPAPEKVAATKRPREVIANKRAWFKSHRREASVCAACSQDATPLPPHPHSAQRSLVSQSAFIRFHPSPKVLTSVLGSTGNSVFQLVGNGW